MSEPARLVHPLEPFVWPLIERDGRVDASSVASAMAATTEARNAYVVVALDVLGVLHRLSLLTRHGEETSDARQWWYTAGAGVVSVHGVRQA